MFKPGHTSWDAVNCYDIVGSRVPRLGEDEPPPIIEPNMPEYLVEARRMGGARGERANEDTRRNLSDLAAEQV